MSYITCIFCNTHAKRAKEHVFPQWLQEVLRISSRTINGTHVSVAGIPKSIRRQSVKSILLGHVCENCNNGWMSNLENKASISLKRILIKNKINQSWDSASCETAGIWAFKTALVLNEASNYRKIVPPEHFKYLYDKKSIPSGVIIDLALNKDNSKLSWRQSQIEVGKSPTNFKEINQVFEALKHSYIITLGIGQFLFCVAYWPLPKYSLLRDSTNYLRIWPTPKSIDFSKLSKSYDIDNFEIELYCRHQDMVKSK